MLRQYKWIKRANIMRSKNNDCSFKCKFVLSVAFLFFLPGALVWAEGGFSATLENQDGEYFWLYSWNFNNAVLQDSNTLVDYCTSDGVDSVKFKFQSFSVTTLFFVALKVQDCNTQEGFDAVFQGGLKADYSYQLSPSLSSPGTVESALWTVLNCTQNSSYPSLDEISSTERTFTFTAPSSLNIVEFSFNFPQEKTGISFGGPLMYVKK